MDQLTLKPRKAVVQEEIENWDDDDLDIGGDDFAFRSASLATTASSLGHHRDSISSRLSGRSFDSNNGDEDRQVHVPGDDERSTLDAIATAARAGIPIPHNVPSSALMGGTIKRLGGRKIKKIIQDDWDDGDLELPGEGGLKIKRQDGANFPDALRQVSGPGSSQASPVKHLQPAPKFNPSPQKLKSKAAAANLLDQFRDDDDDDFLGDGEATIKVAKSRAPNKLIPLITPPTPLQNPKSTAGDDSFENDLQFPTEGGPLKLTARKDIPQTPVNQQENFDEWGEGSLGTRFGGTRRDGRHSNRSSSISALSPSVSSSLTVESEDEGLDGLVLPTGPLNFDDILKRRQEDRSPELETREKRPSKLVEVKDDFLQDLDIGDGDVFDSKKLTLNRNVKIKTVRQTSPTRPKTAVSLTFTNKPPTSLAGSRLPRPLGHERVPSQLAPVSETGGPIASRQRRSQSRMGHSAQSSISSVGTPTTPYSNHSFQPATPRRRDIAPKPSLNALRNEPTTTSAQLLKLKRSLPGLRSHPQSPAKPMTSRYERPPSRTESGSRAMSRPKTPVERDRSGAESSMSHLRRNPLPFLAGGSSTAQSHHVAIKTTSSRHFRRHDSESSTNSTELRPSSRTVSRSTMRSPSPKRQVNRGAEALAREAASKRTITKPVRRRHFGDGFELDGFDDLPTSKDSEQRFIKEPVGRGPPKQSSLRNKFPPEFAHLRTQTPAPFSPVRTRDELPRFARDTNASRMAREQTISQRTPSSGAPLSTMTNQWKSKVNATTGLSAVHAQSVKPKKSKGRLQQPQLIKPLGSLNNPKCKSHFRRAATRFINYYDSNQGYVL